MRPRRPRRSRPVGATAARPRTGLRRPRVALTPCASARPARVFLDFRRIAEPVQDDVRALRGQRGRNAQADATGGSGNARRLFPSAWRVLLSRGDEGWAGCRLRRAFRARHAGQGAPKSRIHALRLHAFDQWLIRMGTTAMEMATTTEIRSRWGALGRPLSQASLKSAKPNPPPQRQRHGERQPVIGSASRTYAQCHTGWPPWTSSKAITLKTMNRQCSRTTRPD